MTDAPRYALYYTPAPGSGLARFGNAVLGTDSATGAAVAPPPGFGDDLDAVARGPRVYGFHATLKAPMRLAAGCGEADLLAETARLAAGRGPVAVGPLVVATLGRFTALVPAAAPPALGLFAAECVAFLDPLRAPPSPAEIGRRRPETLSPRARALLDRWGYPHVFEAFRFHMTLTAALPEAECAPWRERLARLYGGGEDLTVEAVTVLRQDGGAPFRVVQRFPLAG
ncbi:DUF1045 domain-containing protein [uncultured Methylobacterium sp.]|uniref:DUF1045 domain-containing protein n=1 Tax=uncultured Methylobacterium sp. TaxID=157278 RepID=UPI00261C7AAE|nr:DUF1045 domain-containing protein [uncultured Methylobacterium sp.]